jgi:predicted nucleotidyltransferase
MALPRMNAEEIKGSLMDFSPRIFDRHPVLFGYLYGSYATGAVHPFSDLDIAVYSAQTSPRGNMRLELMLALELDEELPDGVKAEVRVINDLPLVVKGRIITTGILIYSRDDSLRADFEASVRKMYFDFQPTIRYYESVYFGTGQF